MQNEKRKITVQGLKDRNLFFFLLRCSFALFAFSFAFYVFLLPQAASAAVIVRPMIHTGLVGYWDFNESEGETAYDRSGNLNHGTLTGMDATTDWVDGQVGGALDFDGSDDYVSVGTDSSLQPTTAITLAAWVQASGNNDNSLHDAIITAEDGSVDDYKFGLKDFGTGSTQGVQVEFNTTGGNGKILYNFEPVSGQWYHIAISWQGGNTEFYVDGMPVQSSTIGSGTLTYPGLTDIIIGKDGGGSGIFNGLIDDVRIYNRALTPVEVRRLYNMGIAGGPKISKPTLSDGLVGYWDFNESEGETAYDRSGNLNHGTLTGMDATTDWVDGQVGGALDFDGSDDYVDLSASNKILTNNDNWTALVWFKREGTTLDGEDERLLTFRRDTTGSAFFFRFDDSEANDPLEFVYHNGGNFVQVSIETLPNVAGTWHHTAVTYDGTSYQTYLNGVADASDSGNFFGFGSGNAIIGNNLDASSEYFDGLIDDVRIYSRALTPDEVKRLYLHTRPRIAKPKLSEGLVGYWRFDEGGGGIVYDHGPHGYHAPLTGIDPTIDWTNGKIHGGLEFRGNNQYVEATLSTGGFSQVSGTIWFNADSVGTNNLLINEGESLIKFRFTSSDKLQLRLNDTNTTGATTISSNTWHHAAFTYDGSTVVIYLNGSQDAIATQSGDVTATESGRLFRLGIQYDNQNEFDGTLDEARIYNRALTPTEVRRIYDMGLN